MSAESSEQLPVWSASNDFDSIASDLRVANKLAESASRATCIERAQKFHLLARAAHRDVLEQMRWSQLTTEERELLNYEATVLHMRLLAQ